MSCRRKFRKPLRRLRFQYGNIVQAEFYHIPMDQGNCLSLLLNGVHLYLVRQVCDLHGNGAAAAANIIDHRALMQMELADADAANFLFRHGNPLSEKCIIPDPMRQFSLPCLWILNQAGIQSFLLNFETFLRRIRANLLLSVRQLISHCHLTRGKPCIQQGFSEEIYIFHPRHEQERLGAVFDFARKSAGRFPMHTVNFCVMIALARL